MAKKNFKKHLLKAGSTVAVAMAMTSVISMQVHAAEVDENLPADIPPVEAGIESNTVVINQAVEPVEANQAISQSNTDIAAENSETSENNQQTELDNNAAAENNESNSGGDLADPGLELPDAPEVPNTEDMGAEDYNEVIGGYNEDVDDYNDAVADYNEGVDDYNSAADEYDQKAQEQYEEDKAAYDEAKAGHEEAEKQYEEVGKQYEEDSAAYQEYLTAKAAYEQAQKEYEEKLAQYEQDQTQYEEGSEAYQNYLTAQAAYEQAQKEYEEKLAQYNKDQTQYEEDNKAYQEYLDALAKFEADQKEYEEKLAQYEQAQAQYEEDSEAYQNYLTAQTAYEQARKEYEEKLAQYDEDYAQYEEDSQAYQEYLAAKAAYEQAKAEYGKVVEAFEAEEAIYDEVTEYNKGVENKNNDINDKNAALENDLNADTVKNIDEVGEINEEVEISQDVLDILKGYDSLIAQQKALEDAAAALENHAGKGAALGSQEYADYLAAVEAYNDNVAVFNDAVTEYNTAVADYNVAVDTYNETKESTTDSSTGTGTSTGTADWGNIKDDTFTHIDVKYAAAASKDVTIENGEKTYSDSVTQYTVTGVYTSEASAKENENRSERQKEYGVTYNDGTGSDTQEMDKNAQYDEFAGDTNGIRFNPKTVTISFYVTLKDENGNNHGITVNLDPSSTYSEGTYYKAEANDMLSKFKDKDGKGLTTVTIDGEEYYDISGKSIFVISALTCDGITANQNRRTGAVTLDGWGMDLILNLQNLIEIHKSDNARKVTYLGYELGRTAQAEAPAAPGEFTGNEPAPMDPPEAPALPTFDMDEPDEVSDPGKAPVAPTAPVAPDEVTDPGEAPVAPTAPVAPEEVTDPGEAPVAPTAPVAPEEVADPGDAPVGPGAFEQTEPEAPVPAVRLNHAKQLEKLAEKIIAVFPEPEIIEDEPVPLAWFHDIAAQDDDGLTEIPDENVPLAEAPKTGDHSLLWAVLSSLSASGMFLLKKKRKAEE